MKEPFLLKRSTELTTILISTWYEEKSYTIYCSNVERLSFGQKNSSRYVQNDRIYKVATSNHL